MKNNLFITILAAASLLATARAAEPAQRNALRAPAYPLITIDPYTSCWSASDYLYDSHTTHWTGQPFPLVGALRVDGKVYRFMGIDAPTGAFDANFGGERHFSVPAVQRSADVQAMQTVYEFVCGPVALTLTFIALRCGVLRQYRVPTHGYTFPCCIPHESESSVPVFPNSIPAIQSRR